MLQAQAWRAAALERCASKATAVLAMMAVAARLDGSKHLRRVEGVSSVLQPALNILPATALRRCRRRLRPRPRLRLLLQYALVQQQRFGMAVLLRKLIITTATAPPTRSARFASTTILVLARARLRHLLPPLVTPAHTVMISQALQLASVSRMA